MKFTLTKLRVRASAALLCAILAAFAVWALYWNGDMRQVVEAQGPQPQTLSLTPTPGPFPPISPVRGVAGDLWADVIIGKPDFTQTAPKSVVPFKVNNPTGVLVDRSVDPGRAYVWDSGNSRILGIDLGKCYEDTGPCSADIVIGQPSGYDHAACNGDSGLQRFPVRAGPTAETLCGIPDHALSPWEGYSLVSMAVDGDGNLYVPDFFNHRVLKYNSPFEGDTVADQVWGHSDFSGRVCNQGTIQSPTAESFCFQSDSVRFVSNFYGAGVEIDSDGNLWVADVGNNRVLRFPVHPDTGVIDSTADLVLGQSSFLTAGPGSSLNGLHAPSAVRFDSKGWLYVADAANSRVLVFKPPFASSMRADGEFGSQLRHPTSLEVDPSDRGIWVVDAGNFMVELWDPTGTSVLKVLGKSAHQPDGNCGPPMRGVVGGQRLCPIGGSVGLDGHGNVLVPVFHATADVFRYPTLNAQAASQLHSEPDKRLFFPPFEDNFRDSKGIHSARGIATWQDQLIVSDIRRLMFWNGLDSMSNGKPADGVIGDRSAVLEWTYCCGRIKVDSAGRLWVLGFEGVHYLEVYQLPLTEHSVPLHTIWKESASFPVLGTTERVALGGRVFGIAPVETGGHLWISDTDNHRVLRIRDPLRDPVVDIILGQEDAAGTDCNQRRPTGAALDELCYPGALTIDRFGNLFVSDHALEIDGNLRLLVFSAESTPVTITKSIFAPPATKVFERAAVGATNLWADPWEPGAIMRQHERGLWAGFWAAATWEPAFDSTNRMVVGYNAYLSPRFVGVYDDPLGPDELPNTFLYDFGSMPYTATFDDNDNLYVGDINRGRVLVYYNPFNNPPPPPTKVPPPRPAPLPEYPVTIEAVNPGPPNCLLRSSTKEHETTLDFRVDRLPGRSDLTLEFRKVTSRHRGHLHLDHARIEEGGTRIIANAQGLWQNLWPYMDKVTLTVRILAGERDGSTPISNWSPAFLLANDQQACDPLLARFDPNGDGTIEHTDMRLAVADFFGPSPTLSSADMRRLVAIYFR